MKRTITNNIKLLWMAYFAGIIINFPIIFGQLTNPDTRMMAGGYYFKASYYEVSLGRWLLYLIDCLRGGLASPFLSFFISLLLISISAIFLADIFSIDNNFAKALIAIMMVSTPCFCYSLSYWYCSDSYALAILLTILSVWSISKGRNGGIYFIAAVGCFICALGLYQAYIGLACGLCVLLLLLELFRGTIKEFIRLFLCMIGLYSVALFLYWMIVKISLLVWNTTMSSYSGANKISVFNSIVNFPHRVVHTYLSFFEYCVGDVIINNSYWKREYFWIIFIVTMLVLLEFILIKRGFLYWVIGTGLIILLPLCLNIIEIIAPERDISILQAGSMCLLIPMGVLIEREERIEVFHYTIYFFAVVIIWTYILQANATYLAVQTTQRQTELVMDMVYDDISEYGDPRNMKLMLAGNINRTYDKGNGNIYKLSDGVWSRMGNFWNTYDGTRQNWYSLFFANKGVKLDGLCTKEEYESIIHKGEFEEMPIYPAKGSIRMIGDTLVVKFDEYITIQ